jgi:hypothetical protein
MKKLVLGTANKFTQIEYEPVEIRCVQPLLDYLNQKYILGAAFIIYNEVLDMYLLYVTGSPHPKVLASYPRFELYNILVYFLGYEPVTDGAILFGHVIAAAKNRNKCIDIAEFVASISNND